jgi:hypothetical protein
MMWVGIAVGRLLGLLVTMMLTNPIAGRLIFARNGAARAAAGALYALLLAAWPVSLALHVATVIAAVLQSRR